MKFIAYNALPICLLILAAFLAYYDKPHWGWCIFGAIILGVTPSGTDSKSNT